ncbi:FAD-binding protein [Candidatus Lokiarchaeum ossiferum]|uniref:FAD-binding protein n=1 Tax=Candidatus Lokiarchaeum ossiferum TaxID=2951803 RepID=UPI00352C72C6
MVITFTKTQMESITDWYDLLIVGAGTAGLTAAIIAARQNLRVLVLEKGSKVGPLPRGESMAYFPLEDEILGKGFIEGIMTVGPSFRRYHSPMDKKQTLVDVHTPYRFFPWHPFIERFEQKAIAAGASILTGVEVLVPIISPSGICIGVQCKNAQEESHEYFALSTIGADGHSSVIGQSFGVDYSTINCPIVKFLGDNAQVDISKTPNPQFFMLSPGQLEIAPHFPPAAAYYFPIGGNKIEAGLMLRMGQVSKMKNINQPSNEEIMKVWAFLKAQYPGFSSVFTDIKVEYEGLTQMPNARMVEHFILGKGGAVLVGDSAGFVDANGSSGLYYGMKMAAEWVGILSVPINQVQETDSNFSQKINDIWKNANREEYENNFRKTDVYKHIKTSYKLIGLSETLIFRWIKTAKGLNNIWGLFSFMIKSAS